MCKSLNFIQTQVYYSAFIKTAKNPKDVTSIFYSNFIKPVGTPQVFQEFFRDSINCLY
jgi:hypothetical protein